MLIYHACEKDSLCLDLYQLMKLVKFLAIMKFMFHFLQLLCFGRRSHYQDLLKSLIPWIYLISTLINIFTNFHFRNTEEIFHQTRQSNGLCMNFIPQVIIFFPGIF